MGTRLAFYGWIMFAISGLFFLVGALRDGDAMTLGAAITWLVGVAMFLFASRSTA